MCERENENKIYRMKTTCDVEQGILITNTHTSICGEITRVVNGTVIRPDTLCYYICMHKYMCACISEAKQIEHIQKKRYTATVFKIYHKML